MDTRAAQTHPVTQIVLDNFTVFDELHVALGPGVNLFIGSNGTGKTHLLKVLYAACDVTHPGRKLADKLVGVFLPSNRALGRLVRHGATGSRVQVKRGPELELEIDFSARDVHPAHARVVGEEAWQAAPLETAYIPTKEMLANAPGFRSLYERREIHFEAIYADIIDRAYLPPLRKEPTGKFQELLMQIEDVIGGEVVTEGEEFFLKGKRHRRKLEFTLVAEGFRKLALLWLLIRNGTLRPGSVLFWDEPEANLNPAMFYGLVHILLALQRQGVQVFLATHDYVILKEFDLQVSPSDQVLFHALYRNEQGVIRHHAAETFTQIHPNAILDTFSDLYEREIQRTVLQESLR